MGFIAQYRVERGQIVRIWVQHSGEFGNVICIYIEQCTYCNKEEGDYTLKEIIKGILMKGLFTEI